MKRQFDAACRQYQVKEARGAGYAEWADGLKSGFPSVKILGKTKQAENPTPEIPQEVKSNNATVRSWGQNLFPVFRQETVSGVTLTPLSNGGYMLNGACTGSANLTVLAPMKAGVYTLSCAFEGTLPDVSAPRVTVYHSANPVVWADIGNQSDSKAVLKFRVTEPCIPQFRIRIQQGHTYDHVKLYPLVVSGEFTSETMPEFVPYYDGGETTAPMLHGIGAYQDEWNPQAGKGLRRIGIKSFDGTEDIWNQGSVNNGGQGFWCFMDQIGGLMFPAYTAGISPKLCTHFQYVPVTYKEAEVNTLAENTQKSMLIFVVDAASFTTLDDWKNFLAAQHAAGTPVTVWFVLANPVPFETNPMPLSCPTGYGQIIQVAGDVPDAPLEVKYLSHGGNMK